MPKDCFAKDTNVELFFSHFLPSTFVDGRRVLAQIARHSRNSQAVVSGASASNSTIRQLAHLNTGARWYWAVLAQLINYSEYYRKTRHSFVGTTWDRRAGTSDS